MDNSTYETVTVNGVRVNFAKILPTENGKTYTLSANLTYTGYFFYYIGKVLPDGTFVNGDSTSSPCLHMWYCLDTPCTAPKTRACTFTASDNATYVVYFAGDDKFARRAKDNLTLSNYQMEEGSVATAYEPYQNLYLPSGT